MVAVKAFRLELLPEDVARLADGLRRLVGTAGHLAAGLEGTTAYLAMDYHAAETLDVALRHLAPAPLETAAPILRGLAEWIDRAWLAGPAFGHGALHPRDVFVTPGTGELSVTGFGVAPALEAIGARPPVRRPYTAPERAAGDAWDVRADVYSLGAIAHELLTGRRPAGPGEQDGTLPPSMAPELRVRIRRVLSKALAESPAQRFQSAMEFIDALVDPVSLDAAASPLSVDTVAEPEASVVETSVPATESAPAQAAAPTPVARRPRARASTATPRPPARVVVREPAIPPEAVPAADPVLARADPALDIADAPLRHHEPPTRSHIAPAPIALPSPFPWVPFAAAIVAALVLGAAGGYQLAIERRATGPLASAASPAPAAKAKSPVPSTPAATDTEVAVIDKPSAASADESAAKTPAGTEKPPVASGRLLVRSTPAGASVAIDGKPSGRTPLTARGLSLASHTIVVSKPGFVSETRRVALSRREPSSNVTVTLAAERPARSGPATTAAATGSLTVDSRPKGAQVTMDGRAIGVTPLSVPGLSPGVHTVRVELAGHKPVTTSVTVKAGETAKIAVTLEEK